MSPDQQFLYVTSSIPGAVRVFSLHPRSARLTLVQVYVVYCLLSRAGCVCGLSQDPVPNVCHLSEFILYHHLLESILLPMGQALTVTVSAEAGWLDL